MANMPGLTERERAIVGNLAAMAAELREFRINATLLASKRVVRRHRGQWVGIAGGQVMAAGKTLEAVLAAADAKGMKRSTLAVGFIDAADRLLLA